jgi:transcriptional regulator with XRE-family HTH domain
MSDYNIRMRLLRERENLTQKEVAEKLGISPSAYNMYEKGKREPNIDTLQKIADFYEVSLDDLIGIIQYPISYTGLIGGPYKTIAEFRNAQKTVDRILDEDFLKESGQQNIPYTTDYRLLMRQKFSRTLVNNEQEIYLIIKFRELNDKGQKKATHYIEDLSKIPEYQKEPTSAPESKIIVLPYFRAGVSAGSGIFILGNEAEDEIELPDLPEYEAADFAIDVNGDSMEPDFSHEDIALVQQDAELFPGDIGVFVVNSNAFIKELGEKELISRNKDYKNIPIHEGDNVVCMGKVIGKVKTDEE